MEPPGSTRSTAAEQQARAERLLPRRTKPALWHLFRSRSRQRPALASPSLSLTRVAPTAELPLVARVMERHEFSSQSFIPLAVAAGYAGRAPDPERPAGKHLALNFVIN
jgi:ureidoglycolate hydrolase